jgi:hypothetical protein
MRPVADREALRLTRLVVSASATALAFWPLADCNAAPNPVWTQVNRVCLTGRSLARWKSLDAAIKETTYSEYCRDEADWAVTTCQRLRDPTVSSTSKQIGAKALVANVGYAPCSFPAPRLPGV